VVGRGIAALPAALAEAELEEKRGSCLSGRALLPLQLYQIGLGVIPEPSPHLEHSHRVEMAGQRMLSHYSNEVLHQSL
jgi:hypothetical protein